MSAHPNRDMIVAKADNMELIVFGWFISSCATNNPDGKRWFAICEHLFPTTEGLGDYFACLPKYKEQCLHWLNGGELDFRKNKECQELIKMKPKGETLWSKEHLFMHDCAEFKKVPPEIE